MWRDAVGWGEWCAGPLEKSADVPQVLVDRLGSDVERSGDGVSSSGRRCSRVARSQVARVKTGRIDCRPAVEFLSGFYRPVPYRHRMPTGMPGFWGRTSGSLPAAVRTDVPVGHVPRLNQARSSVPSRQPTVARRPAGLVADSRIDIER